jgi:hypothetical protein
MFQLADPKKPVKWPVKVKFPDAKGKDVEKSFAVSFYFKTEKEIEKLQETLDDIKFLKDVIHSFHELRDHQGKAIKGTPKDIELVGSITRIKTALIDAFFEFNNGERKN